MSTIADGAGICFVIMPFSSPTGSQYAPDHFTEVYEDLLTPAIEAAGLQPVRADTTVLSRHILGDLLREIESATVVLCDLSGANPNVLFELGWAFRADKPCVLVTDDRTQYPFDLQHSHIQTYHGSLKARLVREEIQQLSELIRNTLHDEERRWSLVQTLGLDARLRTQADGDRDPIAAAILDIREELGKLRSRLDHADGSLKRAVADEPPLREPPPITPRQELQRNEVLAALEDARGHVGRAAQALGVGKSRLYQLVHALDISLDDVRR